MNGLLVGSQLEDALQLGARAQGSSVSQSRCRAASGFGAVPETLPAQKRCRGVCGGE